MAQSTIEWTELTWNPTTGCNKVSQGCKFCYAEIMTRRLQSIGLDKYQYGFNTVKIHPEELMRPFEWRGSKIVFVNSMSDLFHEDIPLDFIKMVFSVMNDCPQHQFQVLTKRAERLAQVSHELNWTKNIWMGVSVENQKVANRIDYLKKTKAHIKFLSLEPLLGPLPNLNLEDIDWVIVGGESGRKARPIKTEWILDIREQCKHQNTAFFFKQWGGSNKKKAGRLLEGKIYDAMPKEYSFS